VSLTSDMNAALLDMFDPDIGFGGTAAFIPLSGDSSSVSVIFHGLQAPDRDSEGSRNLAVLWCSTDITPAVHDKFTINEVTWRVVELIGPTAGFWRCECTRDGRVRP